MTLNTVDIRDLCDAEIKVLQEIAIGKLNKLDFTVSSGLIKGTHLLGVKVICKVQLLLFFVYT